MAAQSLDRFWVEFCLLQERIYQYYLYWPRSARYLQRAVYLQSVTTRSQKCRVKNLILRPLAKRSPGTKLSSTFGEDRAATALFFDTMFGMKWNSSAARASMHRRGVGLDGSKAMPSACWKKASPRNLSLASRWLLPCTSKRPRNQGCLSGEMLQRENTHPNQVGI